MDSDRGHELLLPLLDLLGQRPSPDDVAQALVVGPGAAFGASTSVVFVRDRDELRLVGAFGLSSAERVGFDHVPLSADLPICAALIEGEIVLTGERDIQDDFRDMDSVSVPWSSLLERQSVGSLVNVPIVARGTVVGGYGFATVVERAWTARDLAFLESIASCVSLWLGLPETGLLPEREGDSASIELTDRQRVILDQVAQGRSLPAVATRMGYSVSTVKQEMRRIADTLGTTGRDATVARAQQLGLCRVGAP